MASTADLLADAFERVRDVTQGAVAGLTEDQLAHRVDGTSNSIAWLAWHLARVQDDHVADLAGTEQAWPSWRERFALDLDADDTGYGHGSDQVAAVRASADLLLGYLDDVHGRTVAYVRTLGDADLDDVVDENWDPPVTRAVRLVSVISDDLQHAGQAAFVRGLIDA